MSPLEIRVDGVAVHGGLHGRAVEDLGTAHTLTTRYVAKVGELKAERALLLETRETILEHLAEVDVTRLVVRRVGINEIRAQQLLPEAAQFERGFSKSDRVIARSRLHRNVPDKWVLSGLHLAKGMPHTSERCKYMFLLKK